MPSSPQASTYYSTAVVPKPKRPVPSKKRKRPIGRRRPLAHASVGDKFSLIKTMGLPLVGSNPKSMRPACLVGCAELDVDELADSFDLLAERYHKAQLKVESKRLTTGAEV